MSRETIADLNTQTLIGYTAKRGTAWHYRAEAQGDEPNHYDGPIPVADVHRRLFSWTPVTAPLQAAIINDDGVTTITDDTRQQRRDEVLSTTTANFKQFADILSQLNEHGRVVVLGSQEDINSANQRRGGDWLTIQKVL